MCTKHISNEFSIFRYQLILIPDLPVFEGNELDVKCVPVVCGSTHLLMCRSRNSSFGHSATCNTCISTISRTENFNITYLTPVRTGRHRESRIAKVYVLLLDFFTLKFID